MTSNDLVARVRCHYADKKKDRPHCTGVGVVVYGRIVLCRSCEAMRSLVGEGMAGRKLPGAELLEVARAEEQLSLAEEHLRQAIRSAKAAGAPWSFVTKALGTGSRTARTRLVGTLTEDGRS